MADFQIALASVLLHEGGYSNHRNDNGGATAYGISLRFLQGLPDYAGDITGDGHVDIEDIKELTREHSAAFYRKYFWNHYRLGEVRDQRVANKLFNFFVNMRGKTAAVITQRALNDLGFSLREDGVLGDKSMTAINAAKPNQLLVCVMWRAWEVYRRIIANDPSQQVFANGWRNRAFSDI